MYTSVHRPQALDLNFLHWCARASAAVLVVIWLSLVLTEVVLSRFEAPPEAIYQAFALAIVFAGYAIGWRNELVGGVFAIVGTIAFFLVNYITIESLPSLEAAWFALPGILFLFAWRGEKLHRATQER